MCCIYSFIQFYILLKIKNRSLSLSLTANKLNIWSLSLSGGRPRCSGEPKIKTTENNLCACDRCGERSRASDPPQSRIAVYGKLLCFGFVLLMNTFMAPLKSALIST